MKLSRYFWCTCKKIMRMRRDLSGFSFSSVHVPENVYRFIIRELDHMKLPVSSYTCRNGIVMLDIASIAGMNNEPLIMCLKKYIAVNMSALLNQHSVFIINEKIR